MVYTIHIHADGSADQSEVDRSKNDQVKWHNDGNIDRVVNFNIDGCPFDDTEIPVLAGDDSKIVNPKKGGRFQYNTPPMKAANEPAADPVLIVH